MRANRMNRLSSEESASYQRSSFLSQMMSKVTMSCSYSISSFLKMQLDPTEPQAVGNYTHRTKGHCARSKDGIQLSQKLRNSIE